MFINALTTRPQPVSELARDAGKRSKPLRYPNIIITVTPIGAGQFEVRHGGRTWSRRQPPRS